MIYYSNKNIVIREMQEDDIDIFVKEELLQCWHSDRSKFLARIKDQSNGKCVSLIALYEGQPAGYVSVYINGLDDYINKKRVPEIVDIAVLKKYRNQGIGSILMDISEEVAKHYSDEVWLAVGLHSGYGSAQRMYIKRGYVPDGTGIWYQGKQCKQYEKGITNDDDLVLFLNKKLRQ